MSVQLYSEELSYLCFMPVMISSPGTEISPHILCLSIKCLCLTLLHVRRSYELMRWGTSYHPIIHALLLQQLLMASLLEDSATADYEYDCFLLASVRVSEGLSRGTVSILDSCQPMSDSNDSPSSCASGPLNRLLY